MSESELFSYNSVEVLISSSSFLLLLCNHTLQVNNSAAAKGLVNLDGWIYSSEPEMIPLPYFRPRLLDTGMDEEWKLWHMENTYGRIRRQHRQHPHDFKLKFDIPHLTGECISNNAWIG